MASKPAANTLPTVCRRALTTRDCPLGHDWRPVVAGGPDVPVVTYGDHTADPRPSRETCDRLRVMYNRPACTATHYGEPE